jgi:8-oxo-dGTP pyrophosphatase MutT (NUDIX family)
MKPLRHPLPPPKPGEIDPDLMAKSARTSTAARRSPGQPRRLQVAALCWRRSKKGLRILLITSRDTGRWVLPKGWPMRNRTEAEAAAREAFEEAGLRGEVGKRSIGIYTYQKSLGAGRSIPVVVRLFPLETRELLREYPESGQRRVRWFSPEKAAQRVAEPELRQLIRDFDPEVIVDRAEPPVGTEPATAEPERDGA